MSELAEWLRTVAVSWRAGTGDSFDAVAAAFLALPIQDRARMAEIDVDQIKQDGYHDALDDAGEFE